MNEAPAQLTIPGATCHLALSPDVDREALESVDGEFTAADGVRRRVHFRTLAEVGRMLATGRATGGSPPAGYLVDADLIITRKPGLTEMLAALEDLIRNQEETYFTALEAGGGPA